MKDDFISSPFTSNDLGGNVENKVLQNAFINSGCFVFIIHQKEVKKKKEEKGMQSFPFSHRQIVTYSHLCALQFSEDVGD